MPSHPLGRPTTSWVYRDGDGRQLGCVVRFDAPDRKELFPLTFCRAPDGNREWRWRTFPPPRPLYGLDRLAAAPLAPVLICEGEKTADAAQALFPDHIAITSPGGARAADKANWLPLAGRIVTIWPDADVPGRDYAADAGKLAMQAGAASVALVPVPSGFPQGWDLADEPPAGWDAAAIQGLLDAAEPFAPATDQTVRREPPRPLMRDPGAPEPFPLDALGPLSGAAQALQRLTQAPGAIAAQAVLGAAALAVQGHADVLLPHGEHKPCSLFLLTVAASGERKSACDSRALAAVRERQDELGREHASERHCYDARLAAYQAAQKRAERDGKGARDIIEAALMKLGPAPVPPLSPLLICGEPTIEGLAKLLAVGQPSMGIYSAEGARFIGGHGMTDEAKRRNAGGLSELWDGQALSRVRATDTPMYLPGRRLSLHLMAQPDIAAAFLGDAALADQGLLSRVLTTAPESTAGTRLYRAPDPADQAGMGDFDRRLTDTLTRPLPLRDGTRNELAPRGLPLSQAATRLWIEQYDLIEVAMAEGGGFAPIRGWASKLPEQMARLSAVLTLVADPSAAEICSYAMECARTLALHYATEARRLHGVAATDPHLRLCEKTRLWLLTVWPHPRVSLPDLYQSGPNAVRGAQKAWAVAATLEEHGWLSREKGGAEVNGQFRRDAWTIMREGQ